MDSSRRDNDDYGEVLDKRMRMSPDTIFKPELAKKKKKFINKKIS
jgi:hypothetical protein